MAFGGARARCGFVSMQKLCNVNDATLPMHFLPTTTTTATGIRTKTATTIIKATTIRTATTKKACPRAGANCAVIYAPLERACQFLVVAFCLIPRSRSRSSSSTSTAPLHRRGIHSHCHIHMHSCPIIIHASASTCTPAHIEDFFITWARSLTRLSLLSFASFLLGSRPVINIHA